MQRNSDRLKSIRERLYGENNKKLLLPSAYKTSIAEMEILRAIMLHGTDGVSHGELAKIVRKDRKNLRSYTKKLINRKVIRRDKGKQGKYYVTGNHYGNTLYSAYLLGNMVSERILPDDNLSLTDEEEKTPENTGVRYTSYFRPRFTNDSELQRVLFEFSNILGSLILYVIIQGLNPENNKIIESEENIEKDQLVQEWVKTTLSEVMGPDLLRSFKESILLSLNSILVSPKDPYTDVLNYLGKRPLFQLSEPIISELVQAYARLYPVMFNALEEMRHELPTEVKKFGERLEHQHQRRQQQSLCKHKYNELVFRHKKIKHCRKCHHTVFT